jgi:hypothetical protein
MPDHDALLHTAHQQWGYVTVQQAAAHGFSRQLCGHYCRKGAWLHPARSIYRVRAVPERPDEDLVLVYLLATDPRGRAAGVISHHSALHVHGLVRRRQNGVHVSLDTAVDAATRARLPENVSIFRRRVDLPWSRAGASPRAPGQPPDPRPPRWAEPWQARAKASGASETLNWRRPPLSAEDIEDRGPFRVTSPLRTVIDCIVWRTGASLAAAFEAGLRLELFTVEECLFALDGLPRFPGGRGVQALLDAVRSQAESVQRGIDMLTTRRASIDHSLARYYLPTENDFGEEPAFPPYLLEDHLIPDPELPVQAEQASAQLLAELGGRDVPDEGHASDAAGGPRDADAVSEVHDAVGPGELEDGTEGKEGST